MPAHHDCATLHWQGDPSLLGKSLYVLPLLLSVEQDFPLACPHPLSGDGSSNTCDVCKEGYYLNEPNATSVEILRDPSKYCKSCPSNANCSTPNVTLESHGVPTGFWRASPRTAMLYSCDDSDTCAGSVDLSSRLALLEMARATLSSAQTATKGRSVKSASTMASTSVATTGIASTVPRQSVPLPFSSSSRASQPCLP